MISDRNSFRRFWSHYIPAKEFSSVGAVSGSSANPAFVSATLATTLDTLGLTTGAVTGSAAANTLNTSAITTTLDSLTLNEATPNTLNASVLTSTLTALTLTTGAWTGSAAANTLASSALTTTCSAISMTAGALTAGIVDVTAGASTLAEVGSLGYCAILMTDNGDFIRHVMPLPPQWDYANPLYFRPIWSAGSVTATDTLLWRIRYDTYAWNEAVAAGTLAATNLTTILVADTKANTTADVVQATAWGVLAAGTINPATENFIVIDVNYQTETGLTQAHLLGLEIYYIPKFSADNEAHRVSTNAPTNA